MGLLFFLMLVALGAAVWFLYRIDDKLQSIGDMLWKIANPPDDDEPRSLPGGGPH